MNLSSLFASLPGACSQGILWGVMALGVYTTYRILNISDLTVDGSFATGGCVAAVCLVNGINPPIDAYDCAAYMCITALSEQSIHMGSAPVAIPDFTRGQWYMRKDIADCKYKLNR